MLKCRKTILLVLILVAAAVILDADPPGITLIGAGLIDGKALDKSGLTGQICQAGVPTNCVPKAIFGGLGSDLAYTAMTVSSSLHRIEDRSMALLTLNTWIVFIFCI